MALHPNTEGNAEVERLLIGEAKLFGELMDPDLSCHVDEQPFRQPAARRRPVSLSRSLRFYRELVPEPRGGVGRHVGSQRSGQRSALDGQFYALWRCRTQPGTATGHRPSDAQATRSIGSDPYQRRLPRLTAAANAGADRL